MAALLALLPGGNCLAQSSAPKRERSPSASTAEFSSISQRAMQALDADELDAAIPLFRRALAMNPRWAEGWWSLGTTFYDQNRYAEAALAFEKVIELDPKHGTAHGLLGLCQFELGDDAAALHNIEISKTQGTDIDPQLRDVILYHEGVLLQRMGRFVAAQKSFASLCLGGGRSDELMRAFGMAALHMSDRKFPPQGSEASQVVEVVGRGACLAAYKDFDGAKEIFTHAVDTYPRFPFVHFAFGRELLDAREIPSAVAQFKIEAEQSSDRVLSLLQIAAAEYKVNSAEGLPYARQAVSIAPKVPFAHFLLGLLLMDTGDYDKAVPELEIASKGLQHEPKVFWSLSVAYGHVGRAQEAARARTEFARLSQQAQQETQTASEAPDVQVNTSDGASVVQHN